ncbi:hypothetical protein BDU57DRAFT_350038 [Ampelomyces quisqualis]|uniref:Uncharacterized protein n=1 Tax=Ampelomyces quisqualis TaxID=50730 RepID=A0A6A5QEM3_AMPQU|nr:hypothetical protein BDU57DRAFT_350038 [Ampelomyces quisqualis]
MAWWRRDPFLMCRSPIHGHAQRMLRDHDAALRTCSFSRDPSNPAQHENGRDDTNNRRKNMSQLEWLQLQHYQRLRKRLLENPYKTLFGASNDMLSGKSLADWEWIHKSFPRWMLNEMNNSERPPERSREKSKYPKKVEIRDEAGSMPKAPERPFPEPTFRKTAFERDATSGIVSPSDIRRPQESLHFEVAGASGDAPPVKLERSAHSDTSAPSNAADKKPSNEEMNLFTVGGNLGYRLKGVHATDLTGSQTQEAVAPEPNAFEYSVDRLKSKYAKHRASDHKSWSLDPNVNRTTHVSISNSVVGDSKAWRQTAVSRGAARSANPSPGLEGSDDLALAPEHMEHKLTFQTSNCAVDQSGIEGVESFKEQNSLAPAMEAPTTRPASDTLKHLPQDDIDFLSAAGIRATMGAKRSQVSSDEERKITRHDLQQAFKESREPPPTDPMLEAKIINEQHVRRTEREMRETQPAREVESALQRNGSSIQDAAGDTSAEYSIDKVKRWLENTGASFAKQFWQDPAEHSDVTEMKIYYNGTASHVKKGQAAIRAIVEDLERDVPVSKPLLKRLKSDEEQLDSAMHMFLRRSLNGHAHLHHLRKSQSLGSLKTRFNQTNKELEKAYIDLGTLVGTKAVTNATDSFKRRLATACEVLQKNTQLLRVLAWSLQRRREHPNINPNILLDCRVVMENLLSLRDTQMTLVRLMDRAMLVYGVVPHAAEAIDAVKTEHSQYESCEDPFISARLAADAHLINEIRAHKTIVHEPAREPVSRPATSGVLDIPNPLAHSLFRPFGPVVEKLGIKETHDDAEKLKVSEQASGSRDAALSERAIPTNFQMLKDDPTTTGASPEAAITMPMTEKEVPWCCVSSEASVAVRAPTSLEKINEASSTSRTVKENDRPAAIEPATSTSAEPEAASTGPMPQPIISTATLPTHYTILVHDPQTDTLSITTSTTSPPRDTSPAVPLHQALCALDRPARFIPHITAGLEVVSAKNDILVLRDAIESPASTRPFEMLRTSSSHGDLDMSRGTTNPIDGTTRLSPTGYVGPEESAEQLEKDFEERRKAAGRISGNESAHEHRPPREGTKAKKRGGAGGVVKTAIWVAGMCYVAGVVGEILSAS